MSRKRRKARQVNNAPVIKPIANDNANVVAFEKPKAPAVRYAVQQVPMELLGSEALFREFEPLLAQGCALSRDRYTPAWLWGMAMRDEMQIWAVLGNNKPMGVYVTTTQLYPATGLHVVQIPILGGKGILAAADKIRAALEAFRQERKCHRIEWVGREGLGRMWPGAERIGFACEVG